MKYVWIISITLMSCARVPIQAVQLSDALKDEAERMHQLNLALIDKIFQEKTYLINEFITNEYTPAYLENFKSKLPANTDFKADFADMMQAIYPKINARKDSLTSVLNEQKAGIVNKLNLDYKAFSDAYSEMQNLLRSASKLNEQRADAFGQIKSLSGNRIDVENIDKALNKFITDAGSVGDKSVLLTNTLNSLLK